MKRQIKKLLTAHPFKEFEIHLPSGQIITVSSPETVAVSPKRDEVIVFTKDGNYHFINAANIVDLEVA